MNLLLRGGLWELNYQLNEILMKTKQKLSILFLRAVLPIGSPIKVSTIRNSNNLIDVMDICVWLQTIKIFLQLSFSLASTENRLNCCVVAHVGTKQLRDIAKIK